MDRIRSRQDVRDRRLSQLDRRIEFLTSRNRNDFDRAELAALRWAVDVIRTAIETDVIDELEQHSAFRGCDTN